MSSAKRLPSALAGPRTGLLVIFASHIANGRSAMAFEDGRQRGDFVHVSETARAFLLGLVGPKADGEAFHIGSGVNRTGEEVARLQAASMGRPDIARQITQQARAGDFRRDISDLTRARQRLGYEARQDIVLGLKELAEPVGRQEKQDHVDRARPELGFRGPVE